MNRITDLADGARMLRFSGGPHGDQVDICISKDHMIEVQCWNDGFPNPMGGGGYSLPMPDELIENYHQDQFCSWLESHFWHTRRIDIYNPCSEDIVRSFLGSHTLKSE